MKKENLTKLVKKTSLILVLIFGISTLFTACRKDDDGPGIPDVKKSNYKITVTLNNVTLEDLVSISAVGSSGDLDDSTTWKINGEEQIGQSGISIEEKNFIGSTKTYVIESIKPLYSISSSVQIINSKYDYDDTEIEMSYKIEKNGEIKLEENRNIEVGDDFTKYYDF